MSAVLETRPAPSAPVRQAVAHAAAPRLDLYASIHKAMRAFMADTLVRVGRIDVGDIVDRDEALAQLGALLTACAEHLRHENDFVHTAIEARQPAGCARIAGEHAEHLESIAALRQEAEALLRSPADAAPALALRLYRHLALFVAENLQHMHHEETVHNALLWQHHSDAELHELHGRLMASLTPEQKLDTLRWMLSASTPLEREMTIGGLRAELPPESLLGVMSMLRPRLDARGWLKLATAAGVDPVFTG